MGKKLTFILMKARGDADGMLTAMVHQGSRVYSRKSMKVRVPVKFWDEKLNRVKKGFPSADEINKKIESKIQEFRKTNLNIPDGDDGQCALVYFRKSNERHRKNLLRPISTIDKYETILKNFEYVVHRVLKMETLPFGKLREKEFVENLKMEIRKVKGSDKRMKTNSGWFNYMSVFGTFVNDWNLNSGTQFPINTRLFTAKIPKDEINHAFSLTRKELIKLESYEPSGYKNGEPQLLAKSIFLFQYYTGGIRIQDALTLTNKDIKSGGIEIRIKKSKLTQLFGFCFEQVDSLRHYYPEIYRVAVEKSNISELGISANTLIQIQRLEGIGSLGDYTLPKLRELKNLIVRKSKMQSELGEFIKPINEVIYILQDEIAIRFFQLLRKRPQGFLFPSLSWEKLKGVYSTNATEKLNSQQAYLIHRATTTHNSNLRRISENLGFEVMGGHTPRHTLANHLLNDDNSVEAIQNVLVHSNPKTTMVYLKERHGNPKVNSTLQQSHSVMRMMKEKDERRAN
jgi:integrase